MIAAIFAFVTSPLGKWILGIVGIALFLAGLYHHVWHNGYEYGVAEYAPVDVACKSIDASSPKACGAAIKQLSADLAQEKTNNDGLRKTINEQNLSVQRLADAAAKAKANADAANKQADSDAAFFAERLKGLQQNLRNPSKDPNADADRILRALAADRLLGK